MKVASVEALETAIKAEIKATGETIDSIHEYMNTLTAGTEEHQNESKLAHLQRGRHRGLRMALQIIEQTAKENSLIHGVLIQWRHEDDTYIHTEKAITAQRLDELRQMKNEGMIRIVHERWS